MNPHILLKSVSVRYRLTRERVRSFKEFIIRRLGRRMEYEEFWGLRDVNLQVEPGEVIGIVGRNGAGKSTLLKVIARVLKPTEGECTVLGMVAPLIELGAGFDHELTGRENLYLNGSIFGYNRKQMTERLESIVSFSELEDFIDSPLRTYSSGMIARLGFSVATHVDAEILILDEVLGVGDIAFQKKCVQRIDRYRREGITILFVSHDMERVRSLCDKALWLEGGRALALGEVERVAAEYECFMSRPSPEKEPASGLLGRDEAPEEPSDEILPGRPVRSS